MKKRLIAIFLVLAMALCAFPVSAFADSDETYGGRSVQDIYYAFKDSKGDFYLVNGNQLVSEGSSYKGYVIVIQEVLHRLYLKSGKNIYDPGTIDGIFGANTKDAVICFQNAYINAEAGDGVVGPQTWAKLHYVWDTVLGGPWLVYVN